MTNHKLTTDAEAERAYAHLKDSPRITYPETGERWYFDEVNGILERLLAHRKVAMEIIDELTDGGAHISPDAAGFGYCEYCHSGQPYELEHHDKDCAYAKARALIAAVKGGE